MKLLVLLSLLLSTASYAKGVYYYKFLYGHLHKNPLATSASLTTLSCAHPVKLLSNPTADSDWVKAQVGGHKGFIHKHSIMAKRPKCYQAEYPKFVNFFNLDLSQLYYWGRLYDQYVQFETKVK